MIDLTPITQFLSSLGPWGVLLGAALAVLGPRLTPLLSRIKLPSLTPSAGPSPSPAGPSPSPTPLLDSLAAKRPVIHALLQVLLQRLSQPAAFGAAGDGEDLETKLTSLLVDHLKAPVTPTK
ncbi:hypothetical protein [Limnoglobus roseus]|uniref:Uncharacterized protein n=1 Tax=Limnoglobus roseus TaxID=2598579 RepID=A0A5C1ALK7_9BACT|nr:hypothetical protein [Limnoglobus roseus]QEL19840.1 hypothetical protein PX52LOC_06921 [Limnoglobus roseus]